MTLRIIEAQYQIGTERYYLVYLGKITRGNGGCVIARNRIKTGSSMLRVAGIYKFGGDKKIGEMEVEKNELSNGKVFVKRLEMFLTDAGEFKPEAQR